MTKSASGVIGTPNWGGYALTTFETGQTYTQASATWTVPAVKWGQTSWNPFNYEYNTIWVGIGGFCLNAGCTSVDQHLIQLGTETLVSPTGAVRNYVWYELYPAVSVSIPETVAIGDVVTASITCVANCAAGQTQTWKLTISDQTRKWSWSRTVSFATPAQSAEYIIEAPTYGSSYLPQNNYGMVRFSNVMANNANANLTPGNGVTGSTPWGQTSNPAVPVGQSFDVCYGYGSFTPCQ